ncbi:MAG: glycosyltransferase, partial [Bacillota bacterium]|nr:glycosyltransferase [Bacillota bacterium]
MDHHVSIVIPCRNEKPYLKEMLESIKVTHSDELLEIIIINDGSEDGCCDFLEAKDFHYPWPISLLKEKGIGPAKARNVGAKHAGGDVLLFCDGHLIIDDPLWITKLLAPMADDNIGAVCPGISTTDKQSVGYGCTLGSDLSFVWLPKPSSATVVPVGPGGCLAIKKEVFSIIGGFEEKFPAWGFEDIEISIKMWLFGYRILVAPQVVVAHVFRQKHPYKVDYKDVDYNLLWLAIIHFNQQRLFKVVQMVSQRSYLNENLERLMKSTVWQQSEAYRKKRKYD